MPIPPTAPAPAIPDYENLPAPQGYTSFIKTLGPTVCDLYALTMTQALWKLGIAEKARSVSHVFCRTLTNNGHFSSEGTPDKVPYLVNAGLGLIGEWLEGWRFSDDDLRYLATIRTPDQQRLFSNEFLFWLGQQKLSLDIDAMPEGELIFPQEPALRLSGLFWQQQMMEGAFLHFVSSSTNLATVASQVRLFTQRTAAQEGAALVAISLKDEAALEKAGLADMSLRRNPSIGALQSARAAYMAQWDSTSNVYAGKHYGIPVMGTFAHAWVMLHDTEEQAFDNWAKTYPGTTIFLADTYSTLDGIKTAIRICKKNNLSLKGIRLDSGNTAWLSRAAHALLKEAGYDDAKIFATDRVNRAAAYALFGEAKIEMGTPYSRVTNFGIGSEVAVNLYHPLLDEVMKLAAVSGLDGDELKSRVLRDVVKLSENAGKTTLPGAVDVIRYLEPVNDKGDMRFAGDTIVPLTLGVGDVTLAREIVSINALDNTRKMPFPAGTPFYRPLQPFMRAGEMVQAPYIAGDARAILLNARAQHALSMRRLEADHKRFEKPHLYGFGIEQGLLQARETQTDNVRLEGKRGAQRQRFHLPAAIPA